MNPDAIRYYLKWLDGRPRPLRHYLAFLAFASIFIVAEAAFLRVQLGDWSGSRLVAITATAMLPLGSLFVGMIRLTVGIGAWTLLERLECGYRAGHWRQVWHELMLKYRELIPEIVAHERFHSLLVRVGSDLVTREKLTAEQARWMDELLSHAHANLAAGTAGTSKSKAGFAKPLIVAAAIFSVLSAIVNLIGNRI